MCIHVTYENILIKMLQLASPSSCCLAFAHVKSLDRCYNLLKCLYSKLLFSYGYGRLLQMPPFDRLYTSFYCSAIANIALCCTVFELLTLNNRDLEIWVMGH